MGQMDASMVDGTGDAEIAVQVTQVDAQAMHDAGAFATRNGRLALTLESRGLRRGGIGLASLATGLNDNGTTYFYLSLTEAKKHIKIHQIKHTFGHVNHTNHLCTHDGQHD